MEIYQIISVAIEIDQVYHIASEIGKAFQDGMICSAIYLDVA